MLDLLTTLTLAGFFIGGVMGWVIAISFGVKFIVDKVKRIA